MSTQMRSTAVTFSPDGKKLASASKDGTVYLFDLHTQEKTELLTEPNRGVNAIAFSPDSSTLLSGRWDGEMQTMGRGNPSTYSRFHRRERNDRWVGILT